MAPTRKNGSANMNAGISSTNFAEVQEVVWSSSIASWWHERDLLLMPFTSYWILVIQYQIARQMSDSGLANDLGVNPKTILAWRSAIQSEGAIRPLIKIMRKPKEKGKHKKEDSGVEIKLKKKLRARLKEIDRSRIPSGRSDAGLPQNIFPLGGSPFDKDSALLKPITHAIKVSNLVDVSTKALAQRFNKAAKNGPPGDPHDTEMVLYKHLGLAGDAAAKMLSLRALSIFGNSGAPENLDENKREFYIDLEGKLKTAAAHVRNWSKNYFFDLVAHADMNEDWWDLINLTRLPEKRCPRKHKDLESLDPAARNFVESGIERFEELLRRLEDLSQGKTSIKKQVFSD